MSLYFEDLVYGFQWAEFVEIVFLFPFVSICGFTFNLLTILIMQNKHNKKEDSKPFVKYILLNTVFNCIECSLAPLRLMNECIENGAIYCSSIRELLFIQYFR